MGRLARLLGRPLKRRILHRISVALRAPGAGSRWRQLGTRILDRALANDDIASWVDHRLGIKAAYNAPPIHEHAPHRRPETFEDLLWLFTPAYASRNHSQLLLDEAGYLYRLLRGLPSARVAEVGIFKGGTTFLMAAAGARVVAIDNMVDKRTVESRESSALSFAASLRQALAKAGLEEQVQIVAGDAFEYEVEPETYDLVSLDIYAASSNLVSSLFDHWWPGVRRGGRLLLRDGREPRNPGMQAFGSTLAGCSDIVLEDDPPGRYLIVIKSVGNAE